MPTGHVSNQGNNQAFHSFIHLFNERLLAGDLDVSLENEEYQALLSAIKNAYGIQHTAFDYAHLKDMLASEEWQNPLKRELLLGRAFRLYFKNHLRNGDAQYDPALRADITEDDIKALGASLLFNVNNHIAAANQAGYIPCSISVSPAPVTFAVEFPDQPAADAHNQAYANIPDDLAAARDAADMDPDFKQSCKQQMIAQIGLTELPMAWDSEHECWLKFSLDGEGKLKIQQAKPVADNPGFLQPWEDVGHGLDAQDRLVLQAMPEDPLVGRVRPVLSERVNSIIQEAMKYAVLYHYDADSAQIYRTKFSHILRPTDRRQLWQYRYQGIHEVWSVNENSWVSAENQGLLSTHELQEVNVGSADDPEYTVRWQPKGPQPTPGFIASYTPGFVSSAASLLFPDTGPEHMSTVELEAHLRRKESYHPNPVEANHAVTPYREIVAAWGDYVQSAARGAASLIAEVQQEAEAIAAVDDEVQRKARFEALCNDLAQRKRQEDSHPITLNEQQRTINREQALQELRELVIQLQQLRDATVDEAQKQEFSALLDQVGRNIQVAGFQHAIHAQQQQLNDLNPQSIKVLHPEAFNFSVPGAAPQGGAAAHRALQHRAAVDDVACHAPIPGLTQIFGVEYDGEVYSQGRFVTPEDNISVSVKSKPTQLTEENRAKLFQRQGYSMPITSGIPATFRVDTERRFRISVLSQGEGPLRVRGENESLQDFQLRQLISIKAGVETLLMNGSKAVHAQGAAHIVWFASQYATALKQQGQVPIDVIDPPMDSLNAVEQLLREVADPAGVQRLQVTITADDFPHKRTLTILYGENYHKALNGLDKVQEKSQQLTQAKELSERAQELVAKQQPDLTAAPVVQQSKRTFADISMRTGRGVNEVEPLDDGNPAARRGPPIRN